MRDLMPSREETPCSFFSTTIDYCNVAVLRVAINLSTLNQRGVGVFIEQTRQRCKNRFTHCNVLVNQACQLVFSTEFLEYKVELLAHDPLDFFDRSLAPSFATPSFDAGFAKRDNLFNRIARPDTQGIRHSHDFG